MLFGYVSFRDVLASMTHGGGAKAPNLRSRRVVLTANTAEPVFTTEAGQAISRRRALPNGRAVVGALLISVAAIGSFLAASGGDTGPSTSYLVATRALRAGQTLTTADVRFEPMTLSEELAQRVLNSDIGLDGATVLRDLRAGELLDSADLLAGNTASSTPGSHEITIGTPLERTPTSLVAGDRVTILTTLDDTTRVAVEDAQVIGFDPRPDQIGASGRGILTLAIDDAETVVEVAHLTEIAEITVVRSTRAIADTFPAEWTTGVTP